MEYEAERCEFIPTKDGGYVKVTKIIDRTKVDGRDDFICNVCGFPAYPECKERCGNMRLSK